jgi:hypothetical protein
MATLMKLLAIRIVARSLSFLSNKSRTNLYLRPSLLSSSSFKDVSIEKKATSAPEMSAEKNSKMPTDSRAIITPGVSDRTIFIVVKRSQYAGSPLLPASAKFEY